MRRTATPAAAAAAALAVAAGMVLFFLTSGVPQMIVYHTLSAGSAAAVLLGVRMHRPARPGLWRLVALGLVAMTLGDVAGDLVRGGYPLPVLATPVLYLLAWLSIAVGIRAMARARVPHSDRESVLDAVAVVVAVGLVLWRVLADPALREQGAAAVPSASLVAFPLLQTALLAFYVRLLFAASSRIAAAWVLGLAGVFSLLGSVAYVALTVSGTYEQGAWNNVFWMLGYAAPGLAALLPDMVTLTEPTAARRGLSSSRLVVLSAALLVSTATACFSATHADNLQLFLAVLPVPAVVLWRLRGVLRALQQAVADVEREAGRQALVAAIGQRALDGGPIDALVSEGCRQLGAALGAEVRARVAGAPGAPGDRDRSATLQLSDVPIGPATNPWGHLELRAQGSAGWAPTDLALAQSVANVLATAIARAESDQRVRWTAAHDALTGLPNRAHFMAELEPRLKDPTVDVAVLFLDLDGFKRVNDTLGHAAGDAVLVATAARLLRAVRPSDVVARFAGDEFVILYVGPPGSAVRAVPSLAARMEATLAEPVIVHGTTVAVSASVGTAIAEAAQAGATQRDADELLREADAAMYRRKRVTSA